MRRLLLSALLVAGCAVAAPTPQIVYVTAPPASAVPSPPAPTPQIVYVTPVPTTEQSASAVATPSVPSAPPPTPAPTLPPSPSAEVAAASVIRIKEAYGYALVQPVKNTGDTWVHLEPYGELNIYDADGSVALTGNYTAAAPDMLAPGATGYLLGGTTDLKATQKVEFIARFEPGEQPSAKYPFTKVKQTTTSYGSPSITGLVTNDSDQDGSLTRIVAVLFDAKGKVSGWESTYIESFPAGATKPFEISPLASKPADFELYVIPG